MNERSFSAMIASVAVLLVCAVLWDAFVTPYRRHRHAAAPVPGVTRRDSVAAPSSLHVDTVVVRVPHESTPPGPAQASYIDQLARAETRRRIRASVGYTYLNEVLAESHDSSLHRWDDRFEHRVRVYLPNGAAANFQLAFVDAVRDAFQRWEEAGVPVRFDLSADSERAEVRFHWKVQFDIERTGQTDLGWDQEGRILSGIVTIATFDPKGRQLSPDDVRVVALHEIGHLIGLDHSSDSTDIMFANTRVRDLSARDIRTALMLYRFAPGPVR